MNCKKNEYSLREAELHTLRSLIDSVSEMVSVVRQDGKIVFSNKPFQKWFGEETENRSCFEVIKCKSWETTHCPLIRAKRSGISQSNEIFLDGKYFLETVKPLRLSKGRERKFAIILEDQTSEKKAEVMLKEYAEKYESIFKNALDGIYQIDKNGKFIAANPSFIKMVGYSSFDELTLSLKDGISDLYDSPSDKKEFFQRIKKDGVVRNFETKFRKKDGDTIWVRLNAYPIKTDKGGILRIEGFVEDITEKKLSEINLKKMTERLRKSFAAMITTLSSLLELKDPYTAGHQRRVSKLARAISQEMNLDPDSVEYVRLAGAIHDVGKIAIPSEILTKPGKLFPAEMEIIKLHSEIGYRILKEAHMPEPIPEIVYQHHERLDGSGYPRGLKGDQIIIEARILAVADVIEAISSHRPYRPQLGLDAAREEIEQKKGKLYDKNVVEAAIRVLDKYGGIP